MTPEAQKALEERVALPDVAGIANDGEVAAYINAYGDPSLPPVWGRVRIVDARSVFRRTLKPGSGFDSPGGPTTALVALQDAAASADHPVRNVARAALELFQDEDGEIDAADEEERALVLTLLGALEAGGVATAAAVAKLTGAMQRLQTWPEAHNGGVLLSAQDVGIARGGAA